MREICLYGWLDQGALIASEILVAAAVSEGKYGKSIPCFGLEQENSLQKVLVRIADEPINHSFQQSNVHCVIILDPSIVETVDVYQGLWEKGSVIINETKMAHELTLPKEVTNFGVVDANAIAMEILGSPAVNSVMLGAFAKTTGLLSLCSIMENLAGYFPTRMLVKHKQAVRQGYDSTTVVEIGTVMKEGSRCG